jgi:hypothetical protein
MTQEWRRLGAVGACAGARGAVTLGDAIFVCGEDGRLWRMSRTGASAEPVGDGERRTRLLAAARGQLYAFDEGGPLFAIDPASAAAQRLDGDFLEIHVAAGSGDELYVSGEGLFAVGPSGERSAIGEATWNPRILLPDGESLFSVEENGGLYRIALGDGSWQQLDGDWGDVAAGVAVAGVLYLASIAGWLYAVDRGGEFMPVPCGAPPDTRFLLAGPRALYALEADGALNELAFG